MNRQKRFFDYFLCLAKIEFGALTREEVFDCFDPISSKLLVSLERHNEESQIHFHVYLRTLESVG